MAVDPNLGFFSPSRDNKRLATLAELFNDPDLVRRVAPGRILDYTESREKYFLSRTMHNFPSGTPSH